MSKKWGKKFRSKTIFFWQILPGNMSQWQLASIKEGPRNLPLKFGQNRVSNSWDIVNIEFSVLMVVVVVVCSVIFVSNPTLGYVRLSWGPVGVLTILRMEWHLYIPIGMESSFHSYRNGMLPFHSHRNGVIIPFL